MKIAIYSILILIFLVLSSKLKINIQYLKKQKNSLKIDFDIKIELFLLCIIKITLFSIKQDGIYFLFFRIPYNEIKFEKESIKLIREIHIFDILKKLNVKLERLKLQADIGTENPILTAFLVFATSTFFSIVSAKYKKQIKYKEFYYKINPIYNVNVLEFYLSTKVGLKIWNVLKVVHILRKNKKQNNINMKPSLAKV